MKTLTLIFAFTLLTKMFAADPPKPKPTDMESLAAKLASTEQELRLVKLENIARQKQALVDSANAGIAKLDAESQPLADAACKAAGLPPDPKACRIDVNSHTVTAAPTDPPGPAGPSAGPDKKGK